MTETIELRAGSAPAVIAPAIGGSIAAFQGDGQAILRPTPKKALAEGAVRSFARKLTAEIAADPACDYLVVFVPSGKTGGKSFFAFEPVTHMTNAFNRASEDRDTGTRVLAPGACFSCTMSISVSWNG